jgi:anhydro-N-acetylmuramic acid kinase
LFIGLMSGTSLDGVDAALVDFSDGTPRALATRYAPFDPSLRAQLSALQASGADELQRSALAAIELVHAYAAAVQVLLGDARFDAASVEAIGVHGQTVRHRPELGFTVQLNNPALLAELCGITVVADFRSRDIAAGGQGAPLVPAFHQAVFGSPDRDRVVVNVGGIANISHLPASGNLSGFDTGPGNALMDLWISRNLHLPYDAAGNWASSGTVIPDLLAHLLAEPYFSQPPPKSTGRDLFHAGWLDAQLTGRERAEDVQATLCALTARTIANAVKELAAPNRAVEGFICGGGAHNALLSKLLDAYAPQCGWEPTDKLGVPADWVEAVAFAWLAHQLLERRPANSPLVTGARGPRLLGAIYPA